MTQLGSDNLGYSYREKIVNDLPWLYPNFDSCSTQYIGAADHDSALTTHVGLPASYIEVVGAVDL